MRIRLDKIDQEPFRWDQSEPAPETVLERPEVVGMSEIHWSGSVEPAHPGWRLKAEVDYEQTLACSRCLKPRSEEVRSEIDLFLTVNAVQPLGGEVELETSDLGVLALDEPVLDTAPLLLEHLELNLPMKILCNDDCAGLCPHCGADRNRDPDCCDGRSIDPRWQVLKDLTDS